MGDASFRASLGVGVAELFGRARRGWRRLIGGERERVAAPYEQQFSYRRGERELQYVGRKRKARGQLFGWCTNPRGRSA